jgi:hypothetical protein
VNRVDDDPDLMNDDLDFEGDGARNDQRELVTVLLWSIRQGWAEPRDLLKGAHEYDIEWPEEDEDSVFEEETEQERAMRVLCPETHTVYEWAKAYGEDPQSLLDKFSGVSIGASDAAEAAEYDSWSNGYDQEFESLLGKLSQIRASDGTGTEHEEHDWGGNGYDQDLEFLLDKFSWLSTSTSDGEEAEEYDW